MKVALTKLKNNPKNPRVIRDEKFNKLKQSIEDFPDMLEKRPLVVFTDKDGKFVVLGGNMRLKAAKELGIKELPVIVADEWTEEQKAQFLIKDNVNFGEWNHEELANEWDVIQLQEWGLDLPVNVDVETLDAEDDEYEMPNEIHTDIVVGDLFEIGEHRLLCGDSTDSDAVAKLMNGEKADSCITSPPYNQGNHAGDLFSHGKRKESLYQNDFDNKSKEEYFQFCIDILNNINLVLAEKHSIVWNVSYNAKSRDDYGVILFSNLNPFSIHETIVWNKGGSINLPQIGIYSRKCELVFVMSNYDEYLTSQNYGDCRWNYWETKKINQLENHKATFSIEFAERAIQELTLPSNLIFEPFCGSGTTMVAAHQLNRKCYGMELDPKYCQVIIDRMTKLDSTLQIKRNGKPYKIAS
jgi:DNA modification methylase